MFIFRKNERELMRRNNYTEPKFINLQKALIWVFVTMLIVSGTVRGAEQDKSFRILEKPEKWICCQTENFTIFSNAKEKKTKNIGLKLEMFRKTLQLLSGIASLNSPVPTYIFVFKDDKSFEPFIYERSKESAQVIGFFINHSDANYIALNAEHPDLQTIFHEYIHFFVEYNMPALPLWYNEGLAEYYSTMEIDDDKVVVGRVIDNHLAFLWTVGKINLQELYNTEYGALNYENADDAINFYAQSWLFIHYLFHSGNNELLAQVDKFINFTSQGKDPKEAFQTAFSAGDSFYENELLGYSQQKHFKCTMIRSDELHVNEQVDISPLNYDDTLYRLGDLLARTGKGQFDDANKFFAKSVSVNPDFALAYTGLAYLAEKKGERQTALEYCQQAVEKAPLDPFVQYKYGRCLISTQIINHFLRTQEAEAAVKARGAFQVVINNKPELIDAYAGFGETFIYDKSSPATPGIAALQVALKKMPSRMDVATNLLILYGRKGDLKSAHYIYDNIIKPRGNLFDVKTAEEKLLSFKIEQYGKELAHGNRQQALENLKKIQSTVKDKNLQERINNMLAKDDYLYYHDLYLKASRIGDEHDFEQAYKLLNEVIKGCRDSVLVSDSRKHYRRLTLKQHVQWFNEARAFFRENQFAKAKVLLEKIVANPVDQNLAKEAQEFLDFILKNS